MKRIAEARASGDALVHGNELRQRAIWPVLRDGCTRHRCGKTRPKRAPRALEGWPCRQVSWLAGRRPCSAFPGWLPVASGEELAADSCGGSSGFGPDTQNAGRTGFPFGRPKPAHLHAIKWSVTPQACQRGGKTAAWRWRRSASARKQL